MLERQKVRAERWIAELPKGCWCGYTRDVKGEETDVGGSGRRRSAQLKIIGWTFPTVLVGFTGAWREDEERWSLAKLPQERQAHRVSARLWGPFGMTTAGAIV
eukprot:COSAG02_NODE_4074_length_5829_cov_2.593543_3_plen_103_part_00